MSSRLTHGLAPSLTSFCHHKRTRPCPYPDVQLGGGYTYQWLCAVLLALNYLGDEPDDYDPALHELVTTFLGEVDALRLEGERAGAKTYLEDINLLGRGSTDAASARC